MQSLKTRPNCARFGFGKSATMMGYVLTAFLSYEDVSKCVWRETHISCWEEEEEEVGYVGTCFVGFWIVWEDDAEVEVRRKELLPCRLLMATRFWRYVLVCKWCPAQLTAPLNIPQLWRKPAVTNLIMYVFLHSSPFVSFVHLSTCYEITRLWDSWVDCGVVVRIYIYMLLHVWILSGPNIYISGPHTLMSSLGWIS